MSLHLQVFKFETKGRVYQSITLYGVRTVCTICTRQEPEIHFNIFSTARTKKRYVCHQGYLQELLGLEPTPWNLIWHKSETFLRNYPKLEKKINVKEHLSSSCCINVAFTRSYLNRSCSPILKIDPFLI